MDSRDWLALERVANLHYLRVGWMSSLEVCEELQVVGVGMVRIEESSIRATS